MSAAAHAAANDASRTLSSPTAERERNPVVDILRGFALFGILLVNFPGTEAARAGGADDTVRRLLSFLVSGKFYTTFSFLFGLGFALQLLRAQDRGKRIVPVYIRRMLALFAIGLAHVVLVWTGDVLLMYAFMGLFLILFRNRSAKVLVLVAVLVLAGEYSLSVTEKPWTVGEIVPHITDPEQEQPLEIQATMAFTDASDAYRRVAVATRYGSYTEAVAARFEAWKLSNRFAFRYIWPSAFAMFLIGMCAGRRGWLRHPLQRSALFTRVMLIAGPIWFVLGVLTTYGPQVLGASYHQIHWKVLTLAWILHAPAGSLFYMSTILFLLSRFPQWVARLAPLGSAGRMGLTCYLTQSIAGTLLYYGYGLGLYDNLGKVAGLLVAVVIFSLQIVVSGWWLRHFRFGPFEWLWRSMTYLRLQPMRRERAAV